MAFFASAVIWFDKFIREGRVVGKAPMQKLVFTDEHQRFLGDGVKEREQIRGGEMDAALRIGLTEIRFVTYTVDVNISVVTVDCAAKIETRIKASEP